MDSMETTTCEIHKKYGCPIDTERPVIIVESKCISINKYYKSLVRTQPGLIRKFYHYDSNSTQKILAILFSMVNIKPVKVTLFNDLMIDELTESIKEIMKKYGVKLKYD